MQHGIRVNLSILEYFLTWEFASRVHNGARATVSTAAISSTLMYQGSGVDQLHPLYYCGLQEHAQVLNFLISYRIILV